MTANIYSDPSPVGDRPQSSPPHNAEGHAGENPIQSGPGAIDWTALIEQVKSGEEDGMEQIYKIFGRGVRYHLQCQLGVQELEDKVHDTFLIVVKAIQRGEIREPTG